MFFSSSAIQFAAICSIKLCSRQKQRGDFTKAYFHLVNLICSSFRLIKGNSFELCTTVWETQTCHKSVFNMVVMETSNFCRDDAPHTHDWHRLRQQVAPQYLHWRASSYLQMMPAARRHLLPVMSQTDDYWNSVWRADWWDRGILLLLYFHGFCLVN